VVYNLPVWLRNFYVSEMVKVVEKEQAAMKGVSSDMPAQIAKPPMAR